MLTNIGSLCCTPETNMLYVNYTSKEKSNLKKTRISKSPLSAMVLVSCRARLGVLQRRAVLSLCPQCQGRSRLGAPWGRMAAGPDPALGSPSHPPRSHAPWQHGLMVSAHSLGGLICFIEFSDSQINTHNQCPAEIKSNSSYFAKQS